MKRLFIFFLWLTSTTNFSAQTAVNQPLLDYFENIECQSRICRLSIRELSGFECR
jgi:hypothetical protein